MKKKQLNLKGLMVLNMVIIKGPKGQGSNSYNNAINSGVVQITEPVLRRNFIPSTGGLIGMEYANDSLPIKTVRNTYNIPEDLYVPYFCPDAQICNYMPVLNDADVLTPGMDVTVSIFQNKALRLTYSKGGATDTVDIFTQFPVPYPMILKMIEGGDWFISDWFQQTVGSNFNAQFNSFALSFGQMSFSGFKGSNAIPLSNAKDPYQNQDNIIVVSRFVTINSRRYLVMGMSATAPNPGDNIVVNDFHIFQYHSTNDFSGTVVSSQPSRTL